MSLSVQRPPADTVADVVLGIAGRHQEALAQGMLQKRPLNTGNRQKANIGKLVKLSFISFFSNSVQLA